MNWKFTRKLRFRKMLSLAFVFSMVCAIVFSTPLPIFATMEGGPVTSITNGQIYYIRNKHSGLHLDVDHSGTVAGTNVWQFAYNATHAQQWKVVLQSDGYYKLYPLNAPDLCLDVQGSSNSECDNVWIYSDNGYESSKFKIVKNSDATFRILTKCSNDTKAVVIENASTQESANVFQYTYTSGNPRNDDWEFIKVNEYCAMNWAYFFRGETVPTRISTQYSASHIGIDVPAAAGTPIYSTTDGVVLMKGNSTSMGHYVIIKSDQKDHTNVQLITRNMHMLEDPPVSIGQRVTKNTIIGKVGNTGDSYGNHLHFDVNNLNTWEGSTLRNNFGRTIQPQRMFCDIYFS